jgi:hypothetical protein
VEKSAGAPVLGEGQSIVTAPDYRMDLLPTAQLRHGGAAVLAQPRDLLDRRTPSRACRRRWASPSGSWDPQFDSSRRLPGATERCVDPWVSLGRGVGWRPVPEVVRGRAAQRPITGGTANVTQEMPRRTDRFRDGRAEHAATFVCLSSILSTSGGLLSLSRGQFGGAPVGVAGVRPDRLNRTGTRPGPTRLRAPFPTCLL